MNVEQTTSSSSNNGSTTPKTISVHGGGASVLMIVGILDVDISLLAKAEIMILLLPGIAT